MNSSDLESAPHLLGEAQSCVDEESGVWYEEAAWDTVRSVVHRGQEQVRTQRSVARNEMG